MNRFMRTITSYALLLSVIGITQLDQSSLQARARYAGKEGRGALTQAEPMVKAKLKELAQKRLLDGKKTMATAAAVCCNQTADPKNPLCVDPALPVIEIRQKDIPLWITCSAKYRVMEDLFYDGDDASIINPNPAAAFYGPIGIGINAPQVEIDMNGHTFTYRGFASNAIITYDTIDLDGNYIAQAHNASIKNGSIIGNLDELSIGISLLSSNGTVSNVSSELGSIGFGVDPLAFILDEESQAIDLVPAPVFGAVFDHCYSSLNETGITSFAEGALSNMSVLQCTFEQNGTGVGSSSQLIMARSNVFNSFGNGVNVSGQLTMDACSVLNSQLNGIAAAAGSVATNWNIQNSSVFNSGTNGLVIVGAQNVLISSTQINNSGADGVIVGIRQGKNVQLNNVQVFNANGILLRVDNIDSFKADDCQFANYLQNPLPNNSPANPLVRIEDAFNATLSNSLMNSNSGTSDGCLIRNSQGVTCDSCTINLTSTQSASHPSGFVLQGDVSSSIIKNSSVNGLFSQGISLVRNELNGSNKGIVLENNTIEGALDHGIFVSEATNSVVLGNIIARNKSNGITLDATASRSQVRDNTVIENAGTGLENKGRDNQIYHNFAAGNGKNYAGVALVSKPGRDIGVLDNISSK